MEHHPSRFSYPVFLDLHGITVLVVGGGRIGARKAEGALDAGAAVRLVATNVSSFVHRARIVASGGEVVEREFVEGDVDGVRLAISATGDPATDQRISAAARARGVWTNAADQPADCDFILPAICRTGRVTAAISTDGASPTLAARLRDRFGEFLTADVAHAAEMLATERAAVRARGGSTEDIDWGPRIAALLGPGW